MAVLFRSPESKVAVTNFRAADDCCDMTFNTDFNMDAEHHADQTDKMEYSQLNLTQDEFAKVTNSIPNLNLIRDQLNLEQEFGHIFNSNLVTNFVQCNIKKIMANDNMLPLLTELVINTDDLNSIPCLGNLIK